MKDYSICVGTIGAGIWHSSDCGGHFEKCRMELPYFWELADIRVYALAISPHNPHAIYAGSDQGLHISEDNGRINTAALNEPAVPALHSSEHFRRFRYRSCSLP